MTDRPYVYVVKARDGRAISYHREEAVARQHAKPDNSIEAHWTDERGVPHSCVVTNAQHVPRNPRGFGWGQL